MSLRAIISAILKVPPTSLPDWGTTPWPNWPDEVGAYLKKMGINSFLAQGFFPYPSYSVGVINKEGKLSFSLRTPSSDQKEEKDTIMTFLLVVPVDEHVRNIKILHDLLIVYRGEPEEELQAARSRLLPFSTPVKRQ